MLPSASSITILHAKITAAKNEVTLIVYSYHKVRVLCFLAVTSTATVLRLQKNKYVSSLKIAKEEKKNLVVFQQ